MNLSDFDTTPAIQYFGNPNGRSMSFLDITYKAWGWPGPVIWLTLHISLIIALIWIRLKMKKEGD